MTSVIKPQPLLVGHVIYHIVKAPDGAGDTEFAHLGRVVQDEHLGVALHLRLVSALEATR